MNMMVSWRILIVFDQIHSRQIVLSMEFVVYVFEVLVELSLIRRVPLKMMEFPIDVSKIVWIVMKNSLDILFGMRYALLVLRWRIRTVSSLWMVMMSCSFGHGCLTVGFLEEDKSDVKIMTAETMKGY